MLSKVALTDAIAATAVSASPVIDAPRIIAVSLHKRGTPLGEDVKVVTSALARQAAKVQTKYSHGNAAYKTHTGSDLFKGVSSKVKCQAEPLVDGEDDLLWAGTISVGTPSQSFLIDFDT